MDTLSWTLVQDMELYSYVTSADVYIRCVEKGAADASLILGGEDCSVLCEEYFTRCHGLMFGSVYQDSGRLRDSSDEFFFWGDVTCPAESLPHELCLLQGQQRDLLSEGLFSKLLTLAFTHARLVFLQPCCDGNKRVSRLLTDLQARSLLGQGLTLDPWPSAHAYIDALSRVKAEADLSQLMRLIAHRAPRFAGIEIPEYVELPFVLRSDWRRAMEYA